MSLHSCCLHHRPPSLKKDPLSAPAARHLPLPLPPPPRASLGFNTLSSTPATPLSSVLRALESTELNDGALDSLVGNLTAKEQTLVLKAQRDWRRALLLFRLIRSKDDYTPNPIHYNVVLRTLGRRRRWDELRLLWADMARDRLLPSNTTYATLIDAYAKAGLVKESLLWLKHMRSRGVAPDEVTMNTVVRILKDCRRFDLADTFFKQWCDGRAEFDFLDLELDDEFESDPTSPKHFLLTELFKSGGRLPVSRIGSDADEGPRKPQRAATYNTLIDLHGKAGRLKDAADAFARMLSSGIAPDTTTFNTMINICRLHGQLPEAEALLGKMEEWRVPPDTKTFNIFMSLYASVRNIEALLAYYRKIREAGLSPDTVTHRIVLQALCEHKMVQEVEDVIGEILESRACVDEQLMPVVMKMYVTEGLLDKANNFFEKHCSGGQIASRIYAAIMDVYADQGFWKEAEDVFSLKRDIGQRKDVVEYNVLIKAYGKAKLYDKALSLFQGMRSCGNWPDECTYNSLIQMLSTGDILNKARELLSEMKGAGFRPRCETFSAVIASYSRKELISEAVEIYKEMKALGVEPNEVVFGSLINGFAESGKIEEALHYFRMMRELGLTANQIVLTSLIKAYAKISCWKEAQELYVNMKHLEGGPDIIASNCMINLYGGLGMVSEAKSIFDELRRNGQADGVSYTTMMYLYKSMGMLDEAIDVAQEMSQSGFLTDCASYNNVLSSYAVKGKLRDCGELLWQMVTQKIQPDASTFKILFTLLKKGGLPPEAVLQLESSYIEDKSYSRQAILTSVFSVAGLNSFALESCETFLTAEITLDSSAYNVAIHAYGVSGEVEKSLKLFMKMQDEGLKPDLVTYIYLADCYGRAGMVEGLKRMYGLLKFGEIERSESLFKALIGAYKALGRLNLAELVEQEMRFSISVEEDKESASEGDS